MSMNKKYLLTLTSLLCIGCQNTNTLHLSLYNFEGEFVTQKVAITKDNYYQLSNYAPLEYYKYDGSTAYINNYRDLYSSSNNPRIYLNAKSTGDVKALVIPVNFSDSDISRNEEQLIYIKNAFFGDKDVVNYESVSSYYHKSSYGSLKLTGVVSDFYTYNKSSSEIATGSVTSNTRTILGSALRWFYENNPNFDKDAYDCDKDGYLDVVYIVYNHPFDASGESDIFWAFADHSKKEENNILEGPYASTYVWISYDFLESENYLSDTNVLLHETGHVFGLTDYYNNSPTGTYQPTGYLDMMDTNLGDHTGFSKMLLNWVTPKVVTKPGEITLRSFSTSGDLLLLPTSRGYNNTPYDEYLLVEFYTPTGLNNYFINKQYSFLSGDVQTDFIFPDVYGVKVYHVDARLGYFSMKGSTSYFTTFDHPNLQNILENYRENHTSYCIDFINDNSTSSTTYAENVLYHLLEKDGNNSFFNGEAFTKEDFWYEGDTFGMDTFDTFRFNNGGYLTYNFEVTEMTPNHVKLKINEK